MAASFLIFCTMLWAAVVSVPYDNGYSKIQELAAKRKEGTGELDVSMPGYKPNKDDDYVCHAVPVQYNDINVVRFKPHAKGDTAHHMLLFGCEKPASSRSVWGCGMTCDGDPKILYAWAKNAPPATIPEDVGFQIGKQHGINYLVLQIHYAKAFKGGQQGDSSGVTLEVTSEKQKFIAGMGLMLAGNIAIPPHQKKVHIDVSCIYHGADIFPFAFRTHAHLLGRVISAYQYNGSFHLLGKGNPQWPQAFYPVKVHNKISNGDKLLGRCTYDSTDRTDYTYAGATHTDEMCNFYMMYYTDANAGKSFFECFGNSVSNLWKDPRFPEEESDSPLPKNALLEEEAKTGHHHGPVVDEPEPTKDIDNPKAGLDLQVDKNWPHLQGIKLGQVGGIDTDSKGNVYVFHRGERVWDYSTFNPVTNVFMQKDKGPIKSNTILVFSPNGKLLKQWGANRFYLPHGLTVDHEDNVWVTDVAMHQVMKFKPGSEEPVLTVGIKFEPGNNYNNDHFCKPTAVAVLKNGDFYVSDGYCNHRVIKFDKDGKYLLKWGTVTTTKGAEGYPPAGAFNLPHGLALAEEKDRICVADRENGRIQCFDLKGKFVNQMHPPEFGSSLYDVAYSKLNGGLLYAVNGENNDNKIIQGFTLSLSTGQLMEVWKPAKQGFGRPHTVGVSPDGRSVYVGEIGPNKVWHFESKFDEGIHKSEKKDGSAQADKHEKPDMTLDEVDTMVRENKNEEASENNEVRAADQTTPIVVGVVLIVPVVIVIVITAIVRLRSKLKGTKDYGTGSKKFNIGAIFNRSHSGFQQLNTDELEHLNSDSEDEFTVGAKT